MYMYVLFHHVLKCTGKNTKSCLATCMYNYVFMGLVIEAESFRGVGVGGGGSGCGFSQRQEYLAIRGLLNGILYTKRIPLHSVSNVDVHVVPYFALLGTYRLKVHTAVFA